MAGRRTRRLRRRAARRRRTRQAIGKRQRSRKCRLPLGCPFRRPLGPRRRHARGHLGRLRRHRDRRQTRHHHRQRRRRGERRRPATGGTGGAGAVGGVTAGGTFASGTGGACASRASVDGCGGGGGGGSGIAGAGGTSGAGGTAGEVTDLGGDPGRNGCVSSSRGPDSGFGECPSNTIAMSAGGTSSASRDRRSMVKISRIRMLRCSASDAVSSGPSGLGRRIGIAIGERPGDPGGNRTSRNTLSVRTIPLAKSNAPTGPSTSVSPRRHPASVV